MRSLAGLSRPHSGEAGGEPWGGSAPAFRVCPAGSTRWGYDACPQLPGGWRVSTEGRTGDALPGARPRRHRRRRHRLVHDALRAQAGRQEPLGHRGDDRLRGLLPPPDGRVRPSVAARRPAPGAGGALPLPQALGRHLPLPLPGRAGRGRRRALARQPDPARPGGPKRRRPARRRSRTPRRCSTPRATSSR